MDKFDDIIDSRDIVERVEELEDDQRIDSESFGIDDRRELESLRALVVELETVGGDSPEDGMTLVRDSSFVDYAQELAEDIGAIPSDLSWPARCIDWAQAARELQVDYTPVKWDGVTYWVR